MRALHAALNCRVISISRELNHSRQKSTTESHTRPLTSAYAFLRMTFALKTSCRLSPVPFEDRNELMQTLEETTGF